MSRAGWVYRSDPGAGTSPPAAPGPIVVDVPPPVSERRAAPQPAPAPSLSQQLSYGALTLGIGAAMLPLVMTMIVVLVPMRWLFGGSNER